MPKIKEGEIGKCSVCGGELEEKFWTITGYEKQVTSFPCPECKKMIEIEYEAAVDAWKIKKPCTCTIRLTKEMMEDTPPKWKRSVYGYCNKCFKQIHPGIMFEKLGED